MEFVNLTPHSITVLAPSGQVVFVLAPSGQVARVAMTRVSAPGPGGVEFHVSAPGEVEGLPAPQAGVVYVVSALVRTNPALRGRDDVASPGPLVRDAQGQPSGCAGLELNSMPEPEPRECTCGSGEPWTTCQGLGEGPCYCG